MIAVPSGWFWMGSDEHFEWEAPRHRVFTNAYSLAETTVRRREYAEFLRATDRPPPCEWTNPVFSSPDQPVVGVNWFDAVAYCDWLSRATGAPYRLPTEAEWEKACKGGNDDALYAWGSAAPESFEYYRSRWVAPHPVGESSANGYGLFDIGDNVHEWCLDWFGRDYYQKSPPRNPQGPSRGERRVSRGGSWRHAIKASRSAHRSSLPPEYGYTDYGFRIARGDLPHPG